MNLNLIEKRAKILINKINYILSLGESSEALVARKDIESKLRLDTKILCCEFGNQAIIDFLLENPKLPRCRKTLEKVLDTVPLRRHPIGPKA